MFLLSDVLMFGAAVLASSSAAWAAVSTSIEVYDVLVYSANAAGVGAAVTASDGNQHTVKVMEPLPMIGGMAAAGGVALMNQGGCGLTGLSRNWSMICGEYYHGYPTMMTPLNAPFPSMNVSEMAFWQLLRSRSSISTSTGCRAVAVHRATAESPSCLAQVDFLCDNDTRAVTIRASYLIDASYDGDLGMMAGGIDFVSGREPRSQYNESLAGVSLLDWTEESFDKQGLSTLDPYFPNGTLLKYIDPEPLPLEGTSDDKVMAYEYFACLSNTHGNQVPFYPPIGYNPSDFTLLLRQIQGVMANGKFPDGPPLSYFGDIQCYDSIVEQITGNRDCLFCCGPAPVDSDQPNLNAGWPSANHSRRLEIAQAHRYYIQGSLYFMATDPRVPNHTRANVKSYGYCKDEYTKADPPHFPPQLYVRISNRLQGESLLTQNNIINPQAKPDGVAMGCWTFDQHTMSRHVTHSRTDPKRQVLVNEGFFRAALGSEGRSCSLDGSNCNELASVEGSGSRNWYDVPYGAITPKRGQASNLLVPVAISATSVAYASTRIENMFMDLGSAAGVAVAQLLARAEQRLADGRSVGACPAAGLAVQDANVSGVQDVLTRVYGQKIHGPSLRPPPPYSGVKWYKVSGAGAIEWNGYYVYSSMYQGLPVFRSNSSACPSSLDCALYAWDGTWRIGHYEHEIYYVATHKSDTPPTTGWVVANGTSPAPHVAGPAVH